MEPRGRTDRGTIGERLSSEQSSYQSGKASENGIPLIDTSRSRTINDSNRQFIAHWREREPNRAECGVVRHLRVFVGYGGDGIHFRPRPPTGSRSVRAFGTPCSQTGLPNG